MARINNLSDFLSDVAGAIRTKKGSEEPIAAADFDTEIENLPSSGGADLSEYFNNSITGKSSDGTPYPWESSIKKMPPLENTGTTCQYMFRAFPGNAIDLSNFDTTNVENMKAMFRGCESLTELDLSGFYTPKLYNINEMFMYCSALKKIDMRNFDFTNVESYNQTFVGVPANCLIIVKSQTEKDWITSKFTKLTNVKTVAEYEAEQNA